MNRIKQLKIKKLLFSALFVVVGKCGLYAQYELKPLKTSINNQTVWTMTEGNECDFFYISNLTDGAKGTIEDVVLCLDKKGKPTYEITTSHPKDFTNIGAFECKDSLMLVYEKTVKDVHSIYSNTVAKNVVTSEWNPQLLVKTTAKKHDGHILAMSPDKTKLVVGTFSRTKMSDGRTAHVAVFDYAKGKLFEKEFVTASTMSGTTGAFFIRANNEGTVIFCFYTNGYITKNSKPLTFYLYTADANEVKSYDLDFAGKIGFAQLPQFLITRSGDIMSVGITPSVERNNPNKSAMDIMTQGSAPDSTGAPFMIYFDSKKKELNLVKEPLPRLTQVDMDLHLTKMWTEYCPRVNYRVLFPQSLHEFDDGSFVAMYEPRALSDRVENKEIKAKRYFSGDLLIAYINKNKEFTKFAIYKKNGDIPTAWTKEFPRTGYYFRNNKSYTVYQDKAPGEDRDDYWHTAFITPTDYGTDPIAVDFQKLGVPMNETFSIYNFYENYWIVKYSSSEKDKTYNIGVLHFKDENENEKVDNSNESVEFE